LCRLLIHPSGPNPFVHLHLFGIPGLLFDKESGVGERPY
jgi:hypothetical protein